MGHDTQGDVGLRLADLRKDEPRPAQHPGLRWPLVAAAACGVLLTSFVTLSPVIRFAQVAPSLHVAMEMTSGLAALLAAYLVYGRFRHTASLPELALVVAFVIFGFTNLMLSAVPTAFLGERPDAIILWVGLLARLVGAAAFAAAALAPAVRLAEPGASGPVALAGAFAAFAVVAAAVVLFSGGLPATSHPGGGELPLRLVGPPAVHVLKLLSGVLFAGAVVGFARRAARTGDDLLTWLAAGSVLAAFAQLNYLLFPSLYSNWVYSGDLLRFGFYVVVLFASAREIRSYWRRMAEGEVLEERRRLARELHDGVAQELAFIARRTRGAAGQLDPGAVGQIAAAAERARSEARRAIAALSVGGDEPFETALEQAVEHIAARAGIRLRCDIASSVPPPGAAREHLIRIACEAVSNAVRHSGGRTVAVEYADREGARLRVTDDGCGFDVAAAGADSHGGFGLMIMRERAERIGGELRVRSQPGRGTEVLVVLP